MDIYLKYIGQAWIPDIPARDLTREEVEMFGGEEFLLETGLYVKASEKPAPSSNKLASGGKENK